MNELFKDKFITERGFNSTEEYIQDSIRGNRPWITFPDTNYYLSLFEHGFLKVNNTVRTSNHNIDGFYMIINKGKLQGLADIPAHQGKRGIFKPKEILENLSDGWSIFGQTLKLNAIKVNN